MGNDRLFSIPRGDMAISIHVPAWGTTNRLHPGCHHDTISIHVPAWGTTQIERFYESTNKFQSTFPRGERRSGAGCSDCRKVNFNPRSRVGNDCCLFYNIIQHCYFNPRSRVGNDDTFRSYHSSNDLYFNPRSRVGNDSGSQCMCLPVYLFQSTFPRGERPLSQRCRYAYSYFNPRSRVGNDKMLIDYDKQHVISIHVPAWGTTPIMPIRRLKNIISIHVPAWGTT